MPRILFLIILGGLLCLGSFAFGQNRSECGDVDNDTAINLSDVVYLLDYLYGEGPSPFDPSAADVDLCDSIDMNDVGYLISYIFMGGPAPCSGAADCNHYSGGQVTLDHVDGTLDASSILVGEPVNFYLRFTNDLGTNISTIANGFRVYSPDGATWDDIVIDTVTNPSSAGYIITTWTKYFTVNGSGADTVAVGAQVFMPDTGLTSGQSEVFWAISLPAFDAGDVGKTICLDSSFHAPGVAWKWSTNGLDAYIPSWDGPHCYTIVETPEASVTLDNVINASDNMDSIRTNCLVTFELRYQNNSGGNIDGMDNGFRIYSPDGASWTTTVGDSTGALNSTNFDLIHGIGYYGITGSNADTVSIYGHRMMGPGMPDGFNDIPYTITIGPIDNADAGKTICLDSSYFPPTGQWLWIGQSGSSSYYPYWDGPHCYTIAETPEASVTLDNVINGSDGMDSIKTNRLVTFEFRFQNNSVDKCDGFTNGFKVYSPDGATWTTTVGDSTGVLNSTNWNLVHIINYFGVTGSNADTVGFGGAIIGGLGMPAGFNDIPYTVTIGPIDDADAGKTICLDSTFFPPSGPWNWSLEGSGNVKPYWDGPHCFEIYIPTEPPFVLAATPDTLEFFGYQGYPDPPSQSFYVEEATMGEAIEFQCDWIESFVNIASPNGVTPQSVQVDVATSGLSLGDHYSEIEVWSIDALNTETVVVKLTIEEAPLVADSVIIPTITAAYGIMMQPVVTKLTQAINGASIPLKIPPTVIIDSLTTTGLLTEDWEFAVSYINQDSGWILMGLANMHGAVIPVGETEVFHIHFHPTWADCDFTTSIMWDTALSYDPIRALLFADLDNMDLQVGFDRERDTTYIPPYTPGDIMADGDINITDLIYLVEFMFRGGPPPPILDATDVNGNCAGPNIADLTYLVFYMFQGGAAPQCGCVQGSTAKVAPNQDIVLNSSFQDGVTTITINSTIRLRGLQLELETGAGTVPVNLVDENWDLVYGYSSGVLRLGMLDLKGVRELAAGITTVMELNGECKVISALASDDNHQEWQAVIKAKGSTTPDNFVLYQNFPNPFNPITEIHFSLPWVADVKLEIYNIMGQSVTTLVDEQLSAGEHTCIWDGSNVASGVYFYRLTTQDFIETRKMMLLK